MDFILDFAKNDKYVVFCRIELLSEQRLDALSQAQIGIGVEQDRCAQRVRCSCRATASARLTSSTCCT